MPAGSARVFAAPCPQSSIDPSVTICTPANGATVSSPIHVVAGANDSKPIRVLQVYLDGVKVYEIAASSLDTSINANAGTRRLTVQGLDTASRVFKQTIYVTVTSGPPPPPPPPPPPGGGGLSSIKHIFFMLQENRSFDNYFGRMGQYRRDRGFNDQFDELPLNVQFKDRAGHLVSPYHYQTVCTDNLSPSWNESHYDAHITGTTYTNMSSSTKFLMDRFMLTTGSAPSSIDPDGTRAMGYYDWTDLPYYYELAFQFATSDRFFSPLLSNTIPNRMYMFTGTSFGNVRPVTPPSGGFTQKTIFEALDNAGVSWRYYYLDSSVFLAQFSIWGKDQGKVYNISKFFTDIQNPSTLPSVIFIERGSQTGLDEHPLNNIQKGSAKVKQILDALMASPTWGSSAFILAFDEGGGLYDHVPPQPMPKPDNIAPKLNSTDIAANFDLTGFRVPFIIVSPWIRPHFVSHRVRDVGSILKLIETRFGVGPLTMRDASADDMTEFFDFSNPALLTPPPLPAQPATGVCDKTKQNAPGH
ncbi:MAG TPA: alkaline phosphatase family protein [Terriglobales bacterium]|nr:alkaline phosphatase family protein [Terriglobales bacterium]